jgi:hypothetical protein
LIQIYYLARSERFELPTLRFEDLNRCVALPCMLVDKREKT